MFSYLNSRTAATAVGALATGGAIALLVADAVQSGHWTAEHAFVPLVVCIAVASGHLASSALRAWRPIAAAGFTIAFALSTAVTFSNGIGRLTEASELKAADARAVNDAISAKKGEIAETRQRLDTAQANVERETRTGGCKALCRDWKARVGELQSHLAILQVQLDKLGGARPVNAKAQRLGELAGLLGFDGPHVAQVFGLVEPLLLPMLLELTGIAGFGFGLGHRRGPATVAPEPATVAVPTATVASSPEPTPPKPGNRRPALVAPTATKAAAEADIVQLLGRGPLPSQATLCTRWQVPKYTVSRWLIDFERRGLIVREAEGRCKAIRAV